MIRRRAVVAVLGAACAGACAHVAPPGAAPAVQAPAERQAAAATDSDSTGLREEDLATQSLFRVQYRDERDKGAFRLVLKLATAASFRVETTDRLGRGLWQFAVSGDDALLIDERQKIFCSASDDLRLPDVALGSLSLSGLAAVLMDRLPAELDPVPSEGEYRGRDGGRWTVTGPAAAPEAWTLWQEGEPRLRWSLGTTGERQLSHGGGAELRWRRVATEPLEGPLASPELPQKFREVSCEDWRDGLIRPVVD